MKMPSEHERRRLEEIEAALRASDPGLDRALRTFRPRRTWLIACLAFAWLGAVGIGLTPWWIVTLIVLGPLLAVTCLQVRPAWRISSSSDDGLPPPASSRP
jgi:fatty acid desaturase